VMHCWFHTVEFGIIYVSGALQKKSEWFGASLILSLISVTGPKTIKSFST
jgi:hypothetical protein